MSEGIQVKGEADRERTKIPRTKYPPDKIPHKIPSSKSVSSKTKSGGGFYLGVFCLMDSVGGDYFLGYRHTNMIREYKRKLS